MSNSIQHVVFQQGGPTGLQLVMYHEKGISVYNVITDSGAAYLVPHDDTSRGSFLDLVNDYYSNLG